MIRTQMRLLRWSIFYAKLFEKYNGEFGKKAIFGFLNGQSVLKGKCDKRKLVKGHRPGESRNWGKRLESTLDPPQA